MQGGLITNHKVWQTQAVVRLVGRACDHADIDYRTF